MATEEPPFLTVGTEVSAKFRGAFCEATIQSVKKLVKCKVSLSDSCCTVNHDAIDGDLKLSGVVKVSSPDGELKQGVIIKMTDHSTYTVVFDDGDERTLRRTSLCLKGGRHFQEDETLDHLPLTDPENFGTPVLRTFERRSRRKSVEDEDSVDEDMPVRPKGNESASFLGKVICVECGERKKTWFPALCLRRDMADQGMVIAKDQILIQSFKDGKRLCVNQNDVKQFSKEKEPLLSCVKGDVKIDPILKGAVDKALAYYDCGELPKGWNLDVVCLQDRKEDINTDEDTSDDDDTLFLTKLGKFMDDQGISMGRAPVLGNQEVNLHKLFSLVKGLGGMEQVTTQSKWRAIYSQLGIPTLPPTAAYNLKNVYKKYLLTYEEHEREHQVSDMLKRKSHDHSKPKGDSEKKSLKTDSDSESERKRVRPSRPRSRRKSTDKSSASTTTPSTPLPNTDRRRTKAGTPVLDVLSSEASRRSMNTTVDDSADTEIPAKGHELPSDYMVDVVNSPQSSVMSETDSKDFSDVKSEGDGSFIDSGKYSVGCKILVKYGRGRNQKSYEAKIVDCDNEVKEDTMYFVHYTGWNTRYDEWIKIERILGLSCNPLGRKRSNNFPAKALRERQKEKEKEKEKETKEPAKEKEKEEPKVVEATPTTVPPVPVFCNPDPPPPPPPPVSVAIKAPGRIFTRPTQSRSPPVIVATPEKVLKIAGLPSQKSDPLAADAKPSPVKPRTTRNSMQDAFLWSALEESIGRPHVKVKTEPQSSPSDDDSGTNPPRAKKTRSSFALPTTNIRVHAGKGGTPKRSPPSDEDEEDRDDAPEPAPNDEDSIEQIEEPKASDPLPAYPATDNSSSAASYKETVVQKWIEDSKRVVDDFTARASRSPRSKAASSSDGGNGECGGNASGRTKNSGFPNGRQGARKLKAVEEGSKSTEECSAEDASTEEHSSVHSNDHSMDGPEDTAAASSMCQLAAELQSEASDKDAHTLSDGAVCTDSNGVGSDFAASCEEEDSKAQPDEGDAFVVPPSELSASCVEADFSADKSATDDHGDGEPEQSLSGNGADKDTRGRPKRERKERHKRTRKHSTSTASRGAGGDEGTSENDESPQASPKKRKETCLSPPYKSDLDLLSDLGDLASLDAAERIKVMQTRLSEMKKTYCKLKSEVASIDRRRRRKMKKQMEASSTLKEQMIESR